ncbi:ROK family protein [Angustibacter aerolatus]
MPTPDISVTPGAARLLALLVAHDGLSRAELTERSGLTPGAVTKALSPLIASGHVRELAPQAPAGRGRPRVPLALVADREHVLGVKVTHEEVVGVRTDLRAQVLDVVTEPLAEPSVAAVVDAVTRIARALGGPGVHRLGVAVSGDVDSAHGTVRYSPFLRWRDVPLGRLLAEATGLSVVLEHDVRALAHEERLLGAGRGLRDFAVVTIGTGIGCALVVDGSPVPGAFGVAGELGHVVVDRQGPPCTCGSRGCLEAVASTAALERALHEAVGEPVDVVRGAHLAATGHAAAARCFVDAGDAIGAGMAAVANLFGPQRIVITGEGLDTGLLLPAAATDRFRQQVFGAAGRCELVFRPLPFQQWASGAAAVAVNRALQPVGTTTGTVTGRPDDEAAEPTKELQ